MEPVPPPPPPAVQPPPVSKRLIDRLKDEDTLFPLMAFVGGRGVLFLASYFALKLYPLIHQGGRDPYFADVPWVDGLLRWDFGYYRDVALNGYPTTDLHFANIWPGLPLMARAFMAVGIDVHWAMVIIPNVAGLASMFVLYKLFVELTEDRNASRVALMLFVAYPFNYFQACGYPESLMVLTTAGALLLARRDRHVLAGLVLALGTFCRHLTLIAGVGLLTAQIRQRPTPKQFFLNPRVLALALPWLAPLVFGAFLMSRYGDPLAFLHARALWGDAAWFSVSHVLADGFSDKRHVAFLMFAVFPFAGAFLGLKTKAFREAAVFGCVLTVTLLLVGIEGLGRYSASCWPGFLFWGVYLAKRPALQGPLLAFFALMQGIFFFLFAHQFPIL